jgi:hypothetical protein
MTAIYRHLAAEEDRTRQVIADVLAAVSKDHNCLVLTNPIYPCGVPSPQIARLTRKNVRTGRRPPALASRHERRLPLNLPLTSILARQWEEGGIDTPPDTPAG